MKNLTKLMISCGGTGGHFYPGLSIAREFAGKGGKVKLLLTGKNAAVQRELAAAKGIDAAIVAAPRRPAGIKEFFTFLRLMVTGLGEARRLMMEFRPDAFLAMGSFAGFPASIGAISLQIPLFLHDGNARIGRANRFLSGRARHMALAFPPVNPRGCKCPGTCTGMPLRPEIMARRISKAAAIAELNAQYDIELNPALDTILIFGGSQGAATFNKIFPEVLKSYPNPDFQVLHLTGEGKFEEVSEIYFGAAFPVLALPSAPAMELFYQAADIVLCRAGGSTVAELTFFGKFAFLAPYPHAAEKHQDDNAAFLAAAGAAEIIRDRDCTPDAAAALLRRWRENPEAFRARGREAQKLARPDAAAVILSLIDDEISRPRKNFFGIFPSGK